MVYKIIITILSYPYLSNLSSSTLNSIYSFLCMLFVIFDNNDDDHDVLYVI